MSVPTASSEYISKMVSSWATTPLRRFQRATGLRTREYLQHLRVHKARSLLEFSAMSQQEIAWAVGYEDPGAFRKIFQRLIGLSPGEYRRRFTADQRPGPVA